MDTRFKPVLDHCEISEEEFLNGMPAIFHVGSNPYVNIVAVYEGGRVLIESSTYLSLQQYRRHLQGKPLEIPMVDPIVVEDLKTIQVVLDSILKEGIITKELYAYDDEFWYKKEYVRGLRKIH
jgi:hypothetical protein